MKIGKNDRFTGVCTPPPLDTGLFKCPAEIISVYGRAVNSQYQCRFTIVSPADSLSFLEAEVLLPSFDEPFRMIEDWFTGAVGESFAGKIVFLSNRLPQDTVYESVQPFRGFSCFTAFNGLIDGCRFGDTFQEKNLIQSYRQRLVYKGLKFTERCSGEDFQDSVKILPVTKDAVDQLHGEGPFVIRQVVFLHYLIKKRFDRSPPLVEFTECLSGCKSSSSGLFFLQSLSTGINLVPHPSRGH